MTLRSLRTALAAVALFGMQSVSASIVSIYDVSIDTTPIAGQSGFIDLQFNPGTAGAPTATAEISGFSTTGLLAGPVLTDGDVSGALPGLVVFGNGLPLNALLQPLSPFGTAFSFRVEFGGAFLSAASGSGTTLSMGVLGPDPDYLPLLGANATGSTLAFELGPGSIIYAGSDPGIGVAPVPEPVTCGMLLVGLAFLMLAVRRRNFRPASPAPGSCRY